MQTQENQYTILLWTKLIPEMYFSATMDRSIRVRKWIIRFLFTCSASSFYVLVCAHSLGDYFQHFHHHRHQSFNIIKENNPPPHQCHRFDQFEFTINNYKLQLLMDYMLKMKIFLIIISVLVLISLSLQSTITNYNL